MTPKKRARHTSGPWRADCDTDSGGHFRASIMDDDLSVEIALVTQDLDCSRDDGRIETRISQIRAEANARLIAASPSLLTACEKADAIVGPHMTADEVATVRRILRDAVRLATEVTS